LNPPIHFLNPNYHAILIHYPLGLLGLGLVIELLGFLWPSGSFRSAGRWMLLIGALSTMPAATSGIFAKYDIVRQSAGFREGNWSDIKAAANLSAQQWQFLNRHMLCSLIGAALATIGAVFYLASSPKFPDRPDIFTLGMFLAAMGLMTFGAYNAGENIYRTQFATRPQALADQQIADWHAKTDKATGAEKFSRRLEYYVDTMQVHVIAAGMLGALAAAGIGFSMQRSLQLQEQERTRKPRAESPPRDGLPRDGPSGPQVNESKGMSVTASSAPVRFWAVALLVGLTTAGVGWYIFGHDLGEPLWHVRAIFRDQIWQPFQTDKAQNARLLTHLILGTGILLLSLAFIPIAHWMAKSRFLVAFLGLVLLLAIAAQISVGMLMLYDGDSGPLFHFTPAGASSAEAAAQN